MIQGYHNTDENIRAYANWLRRNCREAGWDKDRGAQCLSVRIELNVIDDRTDIPLELTNTRLSRRAALMPQSRTKCNRAAPWHDQSRPPTSQPSPIIFEKPLEETKLPVQRTIIPPTPCFLSLLSSPLAVHVSLSIIASPSLLLLL